MKRALALIAILICLALPARAVSLRTVSAFGGTDASALAYVELLREYEAQSGNVVEDNSGTSDESWKASVLSDFAAGNEPDLLFFFACSADSAPILRKMVPLSEINAAYPDLALPESDILREADGNVYAIPLRPYFEGLFVNTDLFEQYGAPLPDTWEHLEAAVAIFREAGVVPISVSLSDIPHYLAECTVLAASSPEEYTSRPTALDEVPRSWHRGMELIHHLYTLGAFPENALNTSEAVTSELVRQKKAAMQIDGSWFVNSLPAQSMDTTVVMPMPSSDGESTAIIGGVSMGFYLTRRVWDDPSRRDAAVALLGWLTRPDHLKRLAAQEVTGALAESADAMAARTSDMVRPIQDDMNKNARERWLLECVPAVAVGDMTADECWARVMALAPFGAQIAPPAAAALN